MKERRILFAAFAAAFFLVLPAYAGDAYFKGGFILDPSGGYFDVDQDLGISDKWLISGGSDYGLSEYVYLGFEIEGAYHSIDFVDDDDLYLIPINGFGNGKVKGRVSDIVTLYGGLGFGVNMVVFSGFFDEEDVESKAGMQIMGGAEFGRGARFVVELKWQKTFGDFLDIENFELPTRIIVYAGIGF